MSTCAAEPGTSTQRLLAEIEAHFAMARVASRENELIAAARDELIQLDWAMRLVMEAHARDRGPKSAAENDVTSDAEVPPELRDGRIVDTPHPDSLPDGSLSKSTAKRIEALAKLPLLPAGDGARVTDIMVREALAHCPFDLTPPARWAWLADKLNAYMIDPSQMDRDDAESAARVAALMAADETSDPARREGGDGARVTDGWRVIRFTGSFKRGSERWEVYSPDGSGGAVEEADIRDWVVRGLLDALAAREGGDGTRLPAGWHIKRIEDGMIIVSGPIGGVTVQEDRGRIAERVLWALADAILTGRAQGDGALCVLCVPVGKCEKRMALCDAKRAGDGGRVTEEEWQATDAEILEWVERHGLGGMSVTDARCAFEDARTAHLAAREHTNGN